MDLNRHQTDEQLETYILGRLRDCELAALEEHLIVCAACRGRLDTMEHFSAGMKEALALKAAETASLPRRVTWFEWLRRPAVSMAVAFLAVLAIVSVFSTGHSKMAPVSVLTLTATRGEVPTASSARELDLLLSDSPTDGNVFRVEVMNALGQSVWSGLAQSTPSGVQVKAQRPFPAGDYFVRLRGPSGDVLREYGFRIRP